MPKHSGDGFKVDTDALRRDAEKWEQASSDFTKDSTCDPLTDFKWIPQAGEFVKRANEMLDRFAQLRTQGSQAFAAVGTSLTKSANDYDATDSEVF